MRRSAAPRCAATSRRPSSARRRGSWLRTLRARTCSARSRGARTRGSSSSRTTAPSSASTSTVSSWAACTPLEHAAAARSRLSSWACAARLARTTPSPSASTRWALAPGSTTAKWRSLWAPTARTSLTTTRTTHRRSGRRGSPRRRHIAPTSSYPTTNRSSWRCSPPRSCPRTSSRRDTPSASRAIAAPAAMGMTTATLSPCVCARTWTTPRPQTWPSCS
mmetsp:Transcript_72/g.244  ORF Transcript_72/g.244 Transcript_72/m.244 type:complete len:220 (-) Transcript_72:1268-1927(-)